MEGRRTGWMDGFWTCVLLLMVVQSAVTADQVQAQPPTWWTYYWGNGNADWGRTKDEAHSGKYSAFMRGTAYGDDGSIHNGLMAGKSDGYTGPEAYPVLPNTTVSFSFWMKGDFVRIGVFALCWRTDEAASKDRVWVPLGGEGVLTSPAEVQAFTMSDGVVLNPDWTEYSGTFTTPAEAKRLVLIFMASGADGAENLGTVYVDDVTVDAGQGNIIRNPGAEDPSESSGTVIWDTNRKYTHFFLDFVAMADRELWTQVPYGVTDYEFKGDAVIENECMWLFLHSGKQSGPILYAKIQEQHSIHNALYKIYYSGGPNYGHQPKESRIIRNQPDEVVIEYTESVGLPYPVSATYRLLKDKHWMEAKAVHAHEMGYHGEARVMLVPDYKDGNDYVFDSAYDAPDGGEWPRYPAIPEGAKMVIDLQMTGGQFMWTMTYPSWKNARPYLDLAMDGRLDRWPPWQEGLLQRDWENRVWSALYGRFDDEKLVVGVVNSPGSWHPEIVGTPLEEGKVDGKSVEAGEEYTTKWKVPYSGLWRMTGRMGDGTYTSQEMEASEGSALPFTCPVSGKLEYLILYLYDRTEETPPEVGTPMDVYRETILASTGIEEEESRRSSGETPKGYALRQNFPNPFNQRTKITYVLPEKCRVNLEVWNLLGQKVVDLVHGEREQGAHAVWWDGKDEAGKPVSSGIYFYRIRAGEFVSVRKMLLLQ